MFDEADLTVGLLASLCDSPGDQHLAGSSNRAQAGGHVQRLPAVVIPDGHGLAGFDPDANPQGELRIGRALLPVSGLHLERGANRLGRGLEHG